jgi:hypothetical protein
VQDGRARAEKASDKAGKSQLGLTIIKEAHLRSMPVLGHFILIIRLAWADGPGHPSHRARTELHSGLPSRELELENLALQVAALGRYARGLVGYIEWSTVGFRSMGPFPPR